MTISPTSSLSELRAKHRKLLTLANFLDDLPHDKFHMPTYSTDDFNETSCGTAGCACGWAATVFAKDGWSWKRATHIDGGLPSFNWNAGWLGFADFFGISTADAIYICADFVSYQEEYGVYAAQITPRIAADRIRKVIARYATELLEEHSAVGQETEAAADKAAVKQSSPTRVEARYGQIAAAHWLAPPLAALDDCAEDRHSGARPDSVSCHLNTGSGL